MMLAPYLQVKKGFEYKKMCKTGAQNFIVFIYIILLIFWSEAYESIVYLYIILILVYRQRWMSFL